METNRQDDVHRRDENGKPEVPVDDVRESSLIQVSGVTGIDKWSKGQNEKSILKEEQKRNRLFLFEENPHAIEHQITEQEKQLH